MDKLRFLVIMLAGFLPLLATPLPAVADALPATADMSALATDDEDVYTGRLSESRQQAVGGGPLEMTARIAGQWTGTVSPRVALEIRLVNPSPRPVSLRDVRVTFVTDKSLATGRIPAGRVLQRDSLDLGILEPGCSRTVVVRYGNPSRVPKVSIELLVRYEHGGRLFSQRTRMEGRTNIDWYQRAQGNATSDRGLGNAPITAGPIYTYPTPHDLWMRAEVIRIPVHD